MAGYAYPSARYRAALRKARRYRSYGRGLAGWQKGVALAVAAVAISGAAKTVVHHHHHHGHGQSAPAVAAVNAPGSIATSRTAWARAFLRAIPEPVTRCNMSAVTEWELREGGGFGNQAAFNPLNTNPGAGAGWPGYNAIGAWAFPDARTGLAYSVQTIHDGYYGGILAALSAGNDAQAVCNAIQDSPWAASHYGYTLTASC